MSVNLGNDNLRLQIEVPTGGLPNLLRNPSGEMLAAGWTTPFASNSTFTKQVSGGVDVLYLSSQGTSAVRLLSEPVAAVPGEWFAASLQSHSTNGSFTIGLQAVNAAGVVIAFSPTSPYYGHSANRQYSAVWQAPAGTAKVQMVIGLFGPGGVLPGVGTYLRFREAMLTKGATSGAFGTTRTNLVLNPSFETDATGWLGGTRTTSGSTPAGAYHYALARTSSNVATGAPVAVTPGKTYTLSGAVSRPAGSGTITARASFGQYVGGGPGIIGAARSVVGYGAGATVTTSWTRVSTTYTVPAGVTYLEPRFSFEGPAGAVKLDAVLLEETGTARPYFDGTAASLPGATTSWNGTAHASTSKAVAATAFPYNQSWDWADILGPTHSIDIDTSALDAGMLTAEILDATLDPAVASTVRPGKRIRLQSLVDGVWEDVYVGETVEGTTAYAKKKGGSLEDTGAVRVTVQAANAIKRLANQNDARGVETIPELATILEGKGVAWVLNGLSQQKPDAPIVSRNDSASVLDQVAVTRDSNLGHAWIDRHNTLNVIDDTPVTPVVTLTDDLAGSGWEYSYTDADVSYSTASCINQVTIKYLRYNAADNSTEEIAYGPYIDVDSVAAYGAYAAEFTVQAAQEDAVALAALGGQILAANAVPVVTANSVRIKAKDALGIKTATLVDLYTPVRVKYADRVDSVVRVSSIKHSIKATSNGKGSWETEYGFEPVSSVASPTQTPSPPAAANAVGLYSSRYRSTNQATSNGVWTTVQYDSAEASDGIDYASGVWTVPKKGRYAVNAMAHFAYAAGGNRALAINVNGAAKGIYFAAPHPVSGSGTSVVLSKTLKLNAGDQVSITVQQTAGTVNIVGSATRYTCADITYLGI